MCVNNVVSFKIYVLLLWSGQACRLVDAVVSGADERQRTSWSGDLRSYRSVVRSPKLQVSCQQIYEITGQWLGYLRSYRSVVVGYTKLRYVTSTKLKVNGHGIHEITVKRVSLSRCQMMKIMTMLCLLIFRDHNVIIHVHLHTCII